MVGPQYFSEQVVGEGKKEVRKKERMKESKPQDPFRN
jgi:hypothetical protein